MSASSVAMNAPHLPGRARRLRLWLLQSDYLILFLFLGYFLFASWLVPDFVSSQNLKGLLSNMWPLLAVAIGQTVVLITGGIDLSVTSIIGLASITGAWVMNVDSGPLASQALAVSLGIGAMLAVGAGVGLINGLTVSRLRMPPFIVTLTTMMFFSGLAIWLTRSRNISGLPDGFTAMGHGSWLGVSPALICCGVVVVGVHVLLSRTIWGRWMYAVGHNVKTAAISGVPVERTITAAYVLSGICAAAGCVLYTARLQTGSPTLQQRSLLDVIGAVVIGGTSLFGGKGKVVWTCLGVALIACIDNSLNMLDLDWFRQSQFAMVMVAKGTVILIAALIDALRHRLLAGE